MKLKNYLLSAERGTPSRLALSLGISISYLSQLSSGNSPISAARAVALEQLTDGAVTRKDSRPNDWYLIWPDLAVEIEPVA